MSVEPGGEGGDCPVCGEPTVMVGWGSAVVAVYCDPCDLLRALHSDVWVSRVNERGGSEPRLVSGELTEATVWEAG